MKADEVSGSIDSLIASATDINGVQLIARQFEGMEIDQLRSISDAVKTGHENIVMVLASVTGGKVTFIASVTEDLIAKLTLFNVGPIEAIAILKVQAVAYSYAVYPFFPFTVGKSLSEYFESVDISALVIAPVPKAQDGEYAALGCAVCEVYERIDIAEVFFDRTVFKAMD
jgi:hypothetical protein